MADDLRVEYFLLRIRDKLNRDQIKLWLPPYISKDKSDDDGVSLEAMKNLADVLSEDLKIEKNICFTALKELQKHALEKLHEKEVYNDTGVAVIKVKLSGLNFINNNNNPSTVGKILSIKISLSSFTDALRETVSEQISVPPEKIKFIFRGKVLYNHMTLESQGVRHGLQIMGVILCANSYDLQEYEKQVEMLEKMKYDVQLLTNSIGPEDETYLQVADQSGKTLMLPPEEKRSLVSAMALHEKGRAALKKEEYALALLFLLEADKEFSNCNSQLLHSVDNYALLNLDIAWCYLCLKNVTQLPDAESRLKVCESKFKYSYGPNLERLVALKGSSGNEAALLMRLHLLQGIVMFHQNKHDEARKKLKEAQSELSVLKVDDNSLCALMEFGASPAEARIALRATKGCVNTAVNYIQQRKEERENLIRREREERERRQLGFCKDKKQFVEPKRVTELVAMGFNKSVAIEALRQSNNDVNDAINVINQQPELLITSGSTEFDSPVFKELMRQIEIMGFDTSLAKQALKNKNGDLRKAVEHLLATAGTLPSNNSGHQTAIDPVTANSQPLDPKKQLTRKTKSPGNNDSNGASSSSCGSNVAGIPSDQIAEVANMFSKRLKMEQEAFGRFAEDINTNIDDHLDLTLDQEEQFLTQYLSLLI